MTPRLLGLAILGLLTAGCICGCGSTGPKNGAAPPSATWTASVTPTETDTPTVTPTPLCVACSLSGTVSYNVSTSCSHRLLWGVFTSNGYTQAVNDCSLGVWLEWNDDWSGTTYTGPFSAPFSVAFHVAPGTYWLGFDYCVSVCGPSGWFAAGDPKGGVSVTIPNQATYTATGLTVTL